MYDTTVNIPVHVYYHKFITTNDTTFTVVYLPIVRLPSGSAILANFSAFEVAISELPATTTSISASILLM